MMLYVDIYDAVIWHLKANFFATRRRFVLALGGVLGGFAGCLENNATQGTGGNQTPANGDNRTPRIDDNPNAGNGADSIDELDNLADRAFQQKEEVLEALVSALENGIGTADSYDTCLAELEGIPGTLDAARRDAQNALEFAESGGYSNRAQALTLLIEIMGLLREIHSEGRLLCEAGQQNDVQEEQERTENVTDLLDELENKEQELDRIVENIDG